MQKSNTTFIITTLLYTIVIGGILLWSGQDREKNLYDRHRIILQGASFHTSNPIVSRNFYEKIVGLELKDKDKGLDRPADGEDLEFNLPDQKSLYLIPLKEGTLSQSSVITGFTIPASPMPASPIRGGSILIRVRNGVHGLHDKFEQQLNNYKSEIKDHKFFNAKITTIRKSQRGKEFDLIDPDGNTLTFYQRYFFSRE